MTYGRENGSGLLEPRPAAGPRGSWLRRNPRLRILLGSRGVPLCGGFVLAVVALAALVPVLSPYRPSMVNPASRLRGPSAEHWFGTDELGRDVLTRALYGARVSLGVGSAVTLATMTVGLGLGLLSAYYRRADMVIMRVMDGLMAFPTILLAIALMASLGPHALNVVVSLAVVYTAPVARLVRGATLVSKELPYVEAATSLGVPDYLILGRHILPNVLSPVVVQCAFVAASAIISEASLSFLGAGVSPETPTWGNMLRDGQRLLSRAWWVSVIPGVALFLTVLSLNLLGDALRDVLDPRARMLVGGMGQRGAS